MGTVAPLWWPAEESVRWILLDPEAEAVLVCKWSEQLDSYVIATVLTIDIATANMESFVYGVAKVPVLMTKVAKGRAKDNIIKDRKHKDRKHKDRDDGGEYGVHRILNRKAINFRIASGRLPPETPPRPRK